MTTLQKYLNDMAGTSGVGAQGAANKIAGTTGLGIQGALNAICGTSGVGIRKCLNVMAGTTDLGEAAAAGVASTRNLLSANQADVETDTTGFSSGVNSPTLAKSTAQAAHGLASLSATATSANDFGVNTPTVTGIVVGTTYTSIVYLRPNTTARSVNLVMQWRTSGDAFVSNTTGSTSVEDAGAWKKYTVTGVAPATTAGVRVIAQILSAANTEVHYLDKWGLFTGSSTIWTP